MPQRSPPTISICAYFQRVTATAQCVLARNNLGLGLEASPSRRATTAETLAKATEAHVDPYGFDDKSRMFLILSIKRSKLIVNVQWIGTHQR